MARKKRVKSSTGVYHVMLRGINKQNIFFNDDDFVKMAYILHDCQYVVHGDGEVVSSDVCTIYAYAILDNHLHVLIKEGEKSISDIMKVIENRYASYYNNKYERVGHLFQGRFPSEPVEDADYFHRLLRYIHRNPVKAMEAHRPEEYPFCSWNEYVGHKSNVVKVLKPEAMGAVLQRFSLNELIEWVNTENNDRCMDMDSFKDVISDRDSREILAEESGIDNPEDFRLLDPATQINYLLSAIDRGVSLLQASRLGTITYAQLRHARQKKDISGSATIKDIQNEPDYYHDRIRDMEGLAKTTKHRLHLIVDYLLSHPEPNRNDIANHLGLHPENTRRLLVRLINEGLVDICSAAKKSNYRLKSVTEMTNGV